MDSPTKKPDASDELDRLELIHRQMKVEQEAWRNLLESLENMKKKSTRTDLPRTEEPKP